MLCFDEQKFCWIKGVNLWKSDDKDVTTHGWKTLRLQLTETEIKLARLEYFQITIDQTEALSLMGAA